jgi:TPP-dependent pyruvate/acetoin dehydrogenase alpha subunit
MYLLRGGSMRSWFDQLFGNAADLTKGRQIPGHHSLPGGRFVSVSGRVGTQLVQAAGCALAAKLRRDEACVLTSFGEETCDANDFHAAMNVASRFRVPAVFVCRSERRDAGARVGATATVATRAESYGISAVRVEGADAPAVYRAVREARDNAIDGGGPTLVEAVLDLAALFGNAVQGEGGSPSPSDPVAALREFLEECGAWDAARQEDMTARLRQRVAEAVAAARAEPRPALDSVLADVYAETPWMLEEQREGLRDEGAES